MRLISQRSIGEDKGAILAQMRTEEEMMALECNKDAEL